MLVREIVYAVHSGICTAEIKKYNNVIKLSKD